MHRPSHIFIAHHKEQQKYDQLPVLSQQTEDIGKLCLHHPPVFPVQISYEIFQKCQHKHTIKKQSHKPLTQPMYKTESQYYRIHDHNRHCNTEPEPIGFGFCPQMLMKYHRRPDKHQKQIATKHPAVFSYPIIYIHAFCCSPFLH